MIKEPTKQQKKELIRTGKLILKLHNQIFKLNLDILEIDRKNFYDFEEVLASFFNQELHKNFYKFLKDLEK